MVRDVRDIACRNPDSKHGYLVRSSYKILYQLSLNMELFDGCIKVVNSVWELIVPFRIKAFGRRCMLNRLLTRDLLIEKGR